MAGIVSDTADMKSYIAVDPTSDAATNNAATTNAGISDAASTSSSFVSTTIYIATGYVEQVESLKTLTSSDLQVIGWVLWAVIVITLLGNVCSFYAVFDRRNFKKIMTYENPYLLSNVLCFSLSFVDFLQILMVGIPAAICFSSTNTILASSLYNLVAVDPLLDLIVWAQLLLVVSICLDRAGHICRPITYFFKPSIMFLSLLICFAVPFLTLTLPYIIAARVTMQDSESRGITGKSVFLCSHAGMYDDNGAHVANIKIFMSCTLQLGPNWKHSEFYKTWENISNPLILLLAVAAMVGTCAVIVNMLIRSASFQKNNSDRQKEVARGIRTTCIISMMQGVLILASSLPLRCHQIRMRVCPTCGSFDDYYLMTARMLVFLGPMFNSWLYSFRMGNVRTFLASKRQRLLNSGVWRKTQYHISLGRINKEKKVIEHKGINKGVHSTTNTTLISGTTLLEEGN
ncbi:uncharacterized protein LOC134815228 [Bolinopsis microptera]|uniref:uncharacterized protein LOC134815228 n=1 Tax=Bolinopsis microptera TaxID=2820187 RepID=UPI003079B949